MYAAASTYEKLVDIRDYPDLGGSPETIDTTTLTDANYTNILGLQSAETLEFNANYDPADFQTLKALEDGEKHHFAVWFGGTDVAGADPTPTGDLGKFSWDGMLSVRVAGGGVNEARTMVISISTSTKIEATFPSASL